MVVKKSSLTTFDVDICLEIEQIVSSCRMGYMDAVLHYCDVHDMDIELTAAVISKSPKISAALHEEAQDLHYIKRSARLEL